MTQDTIIRSDRIVTIPNILSFCRLLMIPLMWHLYVGCQSPGWTIAVLALSGLTDIADGKIARKFNMTSDLGKILDPMADKLTQLGLLAMLLVQHGELLYVLVLQLVKEIAMGGVGLLVIKRTRTVNSAIWPGKACTVVLYGTLLLLFLFPDMSTTAVWTLVSLCSVAIIGSFLLYMQHYYRLLQAHKAKS